MVSAYYIADAMNELSNELPIEVPGEPADRPKRKYNKRRIHTAEFKSAMIAQCLQGEQSLASIALANRLNSTMLRKWVRDHQQAIGSTFVPVKVGARSARVEPMSGEVSMIEVTLSGGRVRVQGQVDPQALHAVLMALR